MGAEAICADVKISLGTYHTCAILDTGDLKCWGWNSDGQLGYDSTDNKGDEAGEMAALAAVNLGADRTAIAVSTGSYHTCAILDTGDLKCWGANSNGQLGYDSTDSKGDEAGEMAALAAVNLGANRTAIAVSTGSSHTCAILDTGDLKCWGANSDGQLGYDSTGSKGGQAGEMAALAAVNLGANRTAIAVSTGYSYTCAILDTGDLKCWGANFDWSGHLGYDSTDNKGDEAGEMAALAAGKPGGRPHRHRRLDGK